MPGTPPDVTALLKDAAARLGAAGVPDAGLDAERLLRHVLAWDRATLLTAGHASVAEVQRERFLELIAARALRRPLQHLIGTQAFWRHEFLVTPDVLIPRPETEILVEAALARLS
jgi:release factor glutamine methyltransferase